MSGEKHPTKKKAAPSADERMAARMDRVVAAHALMRRLGLEISDVDELLTMAEYLAGEEDS